MIAEWRMKNYLLLPRYLPKKRVLFLFLTVLYARYGGGVGGGKRLGRSLSVSQLKDKEEVKPVQEREVRTDDSIRVMFICGFGGDTVCLIR